MGNATINPLNSNVMAEAILGRFEHIAQQEQEQGRINKEVAQLFQQNRDAQSKIETELCTMITKQGQEQLQIYEETRALIGKQGQEQSKINQDVTNRLVNLNLRTDGLESVVSQLKESVKKSGKKQLQMKKELKGEIETLRKSLAQADPIVGATLAPPDLPSLPDPMALNLGNDPDPTPLELNRPPINFFLVNGKRRFYETDEKSAQPTFYLPWYEWAEHYRNQYWNEASAIFFQTKQQMGLE